MNMYSINLCCVPFAQDGWMVVSAVYQCRSHGVVLLQQVWLPKGVASQTHVNKGQSMPRKLRHVAGLRGPPGTQMTVLNLELDLGQPYQH